MTNFTKNDMLKPLGGLFLMTPFTTVWAIIAEVALANRDYRLVGITFLVIILVFLYFYFLFSSVEKKLPAAIEPQDASEKKQNKSFIIIFVIEGLAIFIVKNILVNINHDEFFVPCFARIVGLHFFPLAAIFKRKFDYYLAMWTSVIAIIGILQTLKKSLPEYLITTFVAIGCAVATSVYGFKMISNGREIVKKVRTQTDL